MEIPFLEPEVIEERAYQLLDDAFGALPDGAVDLKALLFDYLYEEFGLAFYDDRPLGASSRQDILGITYPIRNEVHVDSALASDGHRGRYRFTVAHEIGHWVLHRPLFLDADNCQKDSRLVTMQRDVEAAGESTQDNYSASEWQANQFAIFLLLNDPALQRRYDERFEDRPRYFDDEAPPDCGELREFSRHLATAEVDGATPLAEHFELSAEATAIALEERGYVEVGK